MAFSESDTAKLGYVTESSWGTTDSASRQLVRFTSEDLNDDITPSESEEITDDRQIDDVVQVSRSAVGGFSHELSYGNVDDFLASALASTWSNDYSYTASTISYTAATKTLADSGSGFTPASLPAGKWIQVVDNTNGTWYGRVSTTTATTSAIVFDYVIGSLSDHSAGTSVTIKSDGMLRNGTTKISHTLEKEMNDVTQFFSYTGMRVGTASLAFAAGEKVTGAFSFVGEKGARAGSSVGTGADTAAPTNQIVTSAADISNILEDGSATSESYLSIDWNLDNGLRGQPEIASLENAGVGYGKSRITLDISMYFQNGTAYDRYANNTAYNLSWMATDSAGNVYIFSALSAKPLTSASPITGPNADITLNQSLLCKRNSTYDAQFQIDRFDA